ncbi:MAG: type VI secretion system protein TssA [Comamonadaceae bacterium]|nr:MAG: type VI secretion system protein TssA [Comamonadaceae bacterium]
MTDFTLPRPLTEREPCGPSLEYDHEFTLLLARMAPRTGVQYGSFLNTPETPHWAEIERDCRRLLSRSLDINLLVWLCRAATHQRQAAGLPQALAALNAVLHAWPQDIHPQLTIDGEYEPSVRANALAALSDPHGLMGDVLDLQLAGDTRPGLTVRDVARAFNTSRPTTGASRESMGRELDKLRRGRGDDEVSAISQLTQAATRLHEINGWAQRELGEMAPDLTPLSRLLDFFLPSAFMTAESTDRLVANGAAAQIVAPPGDPSAAQSAVWSAERQGHHAAVQKTSTLFPATATTVAGAADGSRGEALVGMRRIREWFEVHEPSSPVAVLLKQAERLVGKNFAQIVDAIPPDLLQKWTAGEGDHT